MHYTSLPLLVIHRCRNVYYVAYIGKRAQYKQKEGTLSKRQDLAVTYGLSLQRKYMSIYCAWVKVETEC